MDAAPASPDLKPAEAYTVAAMLGDVYAAPGDVFDYLKNAPVRAMTLLTPMFLVVAVGIIYIMVAFSQPGVLPSMREQREKAFQQSVAAGKMTQEKADQMEKITDSFMTPSVTKIIGLVGLLFSTALGLFGMAFLLWLAAGKVHSSAVPYLKVLEGLRLGLQDRCGAKSHTNRFGRLERKLAGEGESDAVYGESEHV